MEHSAAKIYQNAGNLELLRLLPSCAGHVLDCGCGAGDNARILQATGWRVTGITVSAAEQQIAAQYCEAVYLADLEQGLPDGIPRNHYNIILLSHILEHLAWPNRFLKMLAELLAPGGMLAVALPNVLFYKMRISFLVGRFDYTVEGILDETHLRFYTPRTGRQLLESSGYRITTEVADGWVPWQRILRGFFPHPVVQRLNRHACELWPGLFAYQSLYLAEPV